MKTYSSAFGVDVVRSLRSRLLTAMAVVAVLAACSSFVEPDVGDVYVLETADGGALPITRSTEGGTTVSLSADTLRVLADSRYERTSIVANSSSFVRGNPGSGGLVATTETGVLVRTGDRFILRFECPDLALCVAPDTIAFLNNGGEIRDSYLLASAILESDGTLIYRRR